VWFPPADTVHFQSSDPRLWVPSQGRNTPDRGLGRVEYEDEGTGWKTDDQRNGESRADHQQRGTRRSTQLDAVVPPTVLVTALDNGTLVLQGRPDGPQVYLTPAGAVSLKRELAAAFGLTEGGPRDNQDDAR
jgi:hypothetical protein